MSDYIKQVDFAIKDTLPANNPAKIIKGTEFDTEFENIEQSIVTKANKDNAVLTGTPSAPDITPSSLGSQVVNKNYVDNVAAGDLNPSNVSTNSVTATTVNSVNFVQSDVNGGYTGSRLISTFNPDTKVSLANLGIDLTVGGSSIVEVRDTILRSNRTLDMADNKIVNVATPTAADDAANKAYVDGSGFEYNDLYNFTASASSTPLLEEFLQESNDDIPRTLDRSFKVQFAGTFNVRSIVDKDTSTCESRIRFFKNGTLISDLNSGRGGSTNITRNTLTTFNENDILRVIINVEGNEPADDPNERSVGILQILANTNPFRLLAEV